MQQLSWLRVLTACVDETGASLMDATAAQMLRAVLSDTRILPPEEQPYDH